MAIYRLSRLPVFPPAHLADEEGLLAVGGDLTPTRLIRGYREGIFPWYDRLTPILWWSPDPRMILEPQDLKIRRSLRKSMRNRGFEIRGDTAFRKVLVGCAAPRDGEEDTWLIPAMQRAYLRLHLLGVAHSVEIWQDDDLVGGLYGVYLGNAFFGESMFHRVPDASKVALVGLTNYLWEKDIRLIDCQLPTDHLASMGARPISRALYLKRLKQAGAAPTNMSPWRLDNRYLSAELAPRRLADAPKGESPHASNVEKGPEHDPESSSPLLSPPPSFEEPSNRQTGFSDV